MLEKTCLITGANSGIGKATALRLAEMGATVVMLCRDQRRGQAAMAEVRESTGNENIELLLCDLSCQSAIRGAVERFHFKHRALHVLINNAGLNSFKRSVTLDGIETVLAVDYLAPFLLTNLLLNTLTASAPARIITVAGLYHRKATIHFEDLQFTTGFSPMRAANQAQLAKVMFTYELARRLEGTGVTANCVHPGAVKTELQQKLPWHWRLLATPISLLFASPKVGAQPYLHLAASPEVEKVSGRYFNRMKECRSADASYDEAAARRLWTLSEELTKLKTTAA
jgi:NAD(P)-dependent dehydrogenase (short-subunit alcohol dehydrogenase family)